MNQPTAEQIIEHLGLRPLAGEGGFYAETYRSAELVHELSQRFAGPRVWGTAIYFLLTSTCFSKFHRLKSDEVWHFYQGDSVELVQLKSDGTGAVIRLGHDLFHGEQCQSVVELGVWQGAKLAGNGSWALMGCTVTPGFEFADFELASTEELLRTHPTWKSWIEKLT